MYTVYRGGYNSKHPKDFCMSRPNGIYCYLFVIFRSPARLWVGEEQFMVQTNSAVIIRPNVPYQYASLDVEYKNDWLYFEPEDQADFEEKYAALLHRPIPLKDSRQFTQYMQNIVWENNYAVPQYRSQNVSMLLQIVLNKLVQEDKSSKLYGAYSPYAYGLQDIRLNMLSRPYKNFTPAELAEKLGVSASYFQFLYKEFFGIPFKTDLINMRLDYAMDLITETNMTLDQIAFMSGYSNEIHFYRQFKAKTGMTPREYQTSMKSKRLTELHDISL